MLPKNALDRPLATLAGACAAEAPKPRPASRPPLVASAVASAFGSPEGPALPPLLDLLSHAKDAQERQELIGSIGVELGARGLARALDSVVPEPPERTWSELSAIFTRLRELADPRGADALVKWADEKEPPAHWVGEVGQRLAEVGDVRGASYLGERMSHAPERSTDASKFWEADAGGHLSGPISRASSPPACSPSSRSCTPRPGPSCPRRPRRRARLGQGQAPAPRQRPALPRRHGFGEGAQRHARLVLPPEELPQEGAQPPFPSEYETAQSALRYLGWMKDEPSFTKLAISSSARRTQDGHHPGGPRGRRHRHARHGPPRGGLRRVQGLAQWGDARAVKPLIELIEDETWHEEARQAACEALAWCADDKTMADVAKKAKEFAS